MIVLVTALVSLILVGIFIQIAGRLGWGKSVRLDGPQSHLSKAGTPTMGGLAFLLAAVVVWLSWGVLTSDVSAVVLLTCAAALLGWYDDVLSLRRKRRAAAGEDSSTGLLARYRLLGQGIVALIFALYAVRIGQQLFGVGWLDTLGFTFIIMGSINALNFTDGLDGLAAGVSVIILLPLLSFPFSPFLLGALLGFLWYNGHPARVIMGGAGSEALGAALAGIAILSGWVWYLPLLALIPVLEVLSVIIQVAYFRATGGKRFFKMSPLHHHFELSGWSETQVVTRFYLITAIATALAWGLGIGAV
jgi:phospho-N-acetylmuramoyl-pentapeptide-transferase